MSSVGTHVGPRLVHTAAAHGVIPNLSHEELMNQRNGSSELSALEAMFSSQATYNPLFELEAVAITTSEM